jgi:hypothetical protein
MKTSRYPIRWLVFAFVVFQTMAVSQKNGWAIVTVSGNQWFDCVLDSLDVAKLCFHSPDSVMIIPLDSIGTLSRTTPTYSLEGALIGASVGGIIGNLLAPAPSTVHTQILFWDHEWTDSRSNERTISTLTGALLGGGLGYIIGRSAGGTTTYPLSTMTPGVRFGTVQSILERSR